MNNFKVRLKVLVILFVVAMVACATPKNDETQPVSQNPALFIVGPITLSPSMVMIGDSVTVTTSVKNTGDMSGTYSAALFVNGQLSSSEDFFLTAGSTQGITFHLSEPNAGVYNLSMGDSKAALTVYGWVPSAIQNENSDAVIAGVYVDGDEGHLVQFSPPNKAFRVQKIRLLASTKITNTKELNNFVTFRIWDKDANNLLWSQDIPWSTFLNGDWEEVVVPDVRVNDDFRVEVVTHSAAAGGPIDFSLLTGDVVSLADPLFLITGLMGIANDAVLVGFDFPESYLKSPFSKNPPATRSGYSHMGKLINPEWKRLEGINWLIRVEGEGAQGS